MSSPIVNTNANNIQTQTERQVVEKNVNATEQTKEPRAKKVTLSAKYSKFLIFGYSLIQSLKAQDLLTDESVERAYAEIKLMDSVEDQGEFYETYLSQSNETGKVMRKFIVQRNKPPKVPKAKKEKKVKEVQEGDETKETKPKKPRTKKVEKVTADADADIVNELVAAATANADAQDEANAKETEDKKAVKAKEAADKKAAKAKEAEDKKAAKAKEAEDKKAAKAKEAEDKKAAKAKEAEDKKAAKAKEAADKKTAKEAKPTAEVENISVSISEEPETTSVVEEEDEEVHTQEITVDGKEYLLDELNNIYSVITHDEIGTFDPSNRTVHLI